MYRQSHSWLGQRSSEWRRLARDLMVLEVGIVMLVNRGVTVLTSTGDDLTNEDDELKVALRRIVGAIVELEKNPACEKASPCS